MKVINKNAQVWNKLYRDGLFMSYPSEIMVKCIYYYFLDIKNKKILDMGCGSGANLIHLIKMGAKGYGCDISSESVKLVRKRLKQQNLSGEIKISNDKLPFEDSFFDIIVCWTTLYYGNLKIIQNLIKEIKRILKPNGKILITTLRKNDQIIKYSKKIEPKTYKVKSTFPTQKGAVIYAVNGESDILKLFKAFKIFEIGYYESKLKDFISSHWTIFGEKI